jgi:hypothetical protein
LAPFFGHDESKGLIDEARRTLLTLTKTNRRLNSIATPFLYHALDIPDRPTLYLLILSLLNSPRLAYLVREVRVRLNLTDWFPESELEANNRLMKEFPFRGMAMSEKHSRFLSIFPHLKDALTLDHLDCMRFAPTGEEMFGFLLTVTQNLNTLQIIVPSNLDDDYHLVASGTSSPLRVSFAVLPRLERLLIAADGYQDELTVPQQMPGVFLSGRKVKNLEFWAPYLGDEEIGTDGWEHVETLRMEDAEISGRWFYELCKRSHPPLKCLQIQTSYWCDCSEEYDNDKPGLDEDLSLCADTLQKLHIYIDSDDISRQPRLGFQKRLSCLPSMKLLTDLTIQARFLFSSLNDMKTALMSERLPVSLRRLQLSEYGDLCASKNTWSTGGWVETDNDYPHLVMYGVRELAKANDKLPHLESVRVKLEKQDPWGILQDFDERASWKWEDTSDGRFSLLEVVPARLDSSAGDRVVV